MARVLGIETSTAAGSLALIEDGNLVGQKEIDTLLNHSARLLPALNDLLRRSGWSIGDLDAVAVGLGPGSFTGLRVGLAAGQGLALGRSIPLVGIGGFPALVRGSALETGIAVPLLDGGRGRIYCGRYRKDGPEIEELVPPRVTDEEGLKDLAADGYVITPDGLRLRTRLESLGIREWEESFPRARWIAVLAEEKLKPKPEDQLHTAEPIYLAGGKYTQKL